MFSKSGQTNNHHKLAALLSRTVGAGIQINKNKKFETNLVSGHYLCLCGYIGCG